MLNRNYQVFTGTQLYNDFGVTETNGHKLEKDGLFHMLFVASLTEEPKDNIDKQETLHSNGEIYGPFFQWTDAQMWCENINKLFAELRREIGTRLLRTGEYGNV